MLPAIDVFLVVGREVAPVFVMKPEIPAAVIVIAMILVSVAVMIMLRRSLCVTR